MTKVFALLSVSAVLAFASCAEKAAPESTVDTTVVVPTVDTVVAPVVDTVKVDTAHAAH